MEKSVAFLLIVAFGSVLSLAEEPIMLEAPKGFMEDIINGTLEKFRPSIPDPIDISYLPFKFADAFISGNADLYKTHLEGLKSFHVSYIKLTMIGMVVNLTIDLPPITFSTEYDADVVIQDFLPIYGKGTIGLTLEGLKLDVSTQVTLKGLDVTAVKNFWVTIGLEKMQSSITGLLYNDEFGRIVSWILDQLVPAFLRDFAEPITQFISPAVQDLLNEILAKQNETTTSTTGATTPIF